MVATQTGQSGSSPADMATDGDTINTCASPKAPTDGVGKAAKWSIKLEKRLYVYEVIIFYRENGKEIMVLSCRSKFDSMQVHLCITNGVCLRQLLVDVYVNTVFVL